MNPASVYCHRYATYKNSDMELPEIIEYKQFKEQLTKEQQIFDKTHSKQSIDEGEEKILDELINFYSKTTAELEKIDLKNITKDDFDKLNDFLKQFYNVLYPVQNKLDFQKFSRKGCLCQKPNIQIY